MALTFDINGDLIQSRVFLANPQKKYIGELNSVKEFKIAKNSGNLCEASFIVYEYENEEHTEYYNDILVKKLIEIQYLGWFEVTEANPVQEENSPFEIKRVKCLSLENKLVNKNIDDINGVFSLYDITDTEKSLLHIVARLTNWKIGHVSNELIGKKRTFSIDTSKIYNLLTTDVSKSFECIFVFDTYAKTINAYTIENYGILTDIVIHGRNILKGYERICKGEEIVTKLKVIGGNGLDIRDVNPTATNYLINIDYFLDWLTEGTRNAYNSYRTAYDSLVNTYNIYRANLKTQLKELTTLNTQLTDLEGFKKAKEEIQGSYIQLYGRTPPSGTSEYTSYLNATNAIATYVTQIALKKVEIINKENQVKNTRTLLDNIGKDLNMNNYFTSVQLDELSDFLTEGDTYEDSTFIETDTMSQEEILDVKLELMENGNKELLRVSQPQFTTTISASNLFSMKDEPDSPISYHEWVGKLEVGNLITIKFRDDYWVTARLVKIEVDYDNLSEIQLTFSNKSRFDDADGQLGEIIANTERMANSLSLKKYGYDSASKQVNEIREFMNGVLDATLNDMQNNDNQELLIDAYGLHMRKWLPDQLKYDDRQAWWNNNTLMFSDDGFKSSKMAIGQITTEAGEEVYGIVGDVIIGQIFIGEKLKLRGSGAELDLSANNIITGMSASIIANADGLRSKVSSTDYNGNTITSLINQSSSKINMNALNIDLSGYVTITNLATAGRTVINGGNITSGTITGININGTYINGGSIFGSTITSTTWKGTPAGTYESELFIEGGEIRIGRTYYINGQSNSWETSATINGLGFKAPNGTFSTLTMGSSADGVIYENGTLRPVTTSRWYNLGNKSYPWETGYFNEIYLKGKILNLLDVKDMSALYPQSNSNNYYAYLNTSMEFVPNTSNSSYPFSIGSSSYPWEKGYFKNLYINGYLAEAFTKNSINSLYSATSYYVTLNSNRELVPNVNSSSYTFNIGSPSYPWTKIYFKDFCHVASDGTIGFFGKQPTTIKSVAKIASTSSATAATNAVKINDLLTALAAYGIIAST